MRRSGGILRSPRLYSLVGILLAISLLVTYLPPTVPRANTQTDSPASHPSSGGLPSPTSDQITSAGANQASAEPPAPLPEPKKTSITVKPDQEFELESASKKAKLKIPKGAVSEEVEIEFIEHVPWGSTGTKFLNVFEFNAYATQRNKAKVNEFQKKLELTIKHELSDFAGLDIDSVRLYYLDDETRRWVPVGGKFDQKETAFTASIDHFSYYGEQANPVITGPGKVMAAQVGLHSGSATFSYPIEVPPGAGGFQPKIEISYNSASVDEMKNKQSVGSWVGIGWTLHLGRISYDAGSDSYSLDLRGESYKMVKESETLYRTVPETFYRITRSGETWTMVDREGNSYQFGGSLDSQQYYQWTAPLEVYPIHTTYYRWDMVRMWRPQGHSIFVSYVQDYRYSYNPYGTPLTTVRSAYPAHVYYNQSHVDIQFNSSYDYTAPNYGPSRNDVPNVSSVTETRKLNSIEVRVDGNLVRKYAFAYSVTPTHSDPAVGTVAGTQVLTSIAEFGADGTSSLPALSFTYANLQTYLKDTSIPTQEGNPGNPASFEWPHLTSIANGFGGNVIFTYTQTPTMPVENIWTREVVTIKTTNPGIGPTFSTQYSYTGDPRYLKLPPTQLSTAQFRGFPEVRETDAVGNYTRHYFWTTGTLRDELFTGKEQKTEWYDAAGNQLKRQEFSWDYRPTSNKLTLLLPPTQGSAFSALDMAVDKEGNAYVVNGGATVSKYDSANTLIGSWTMYDPSVGLYGYGRSIGVDPQGYVFVGDSNDSIWKFSNTGSLVRRWATWYSEPPEYPWSLTSMAVDASGYVYALYRYGPVQVFDASGNFIRQFSGGDYADIAVGNDGLVYLLHTSRARVDRYFSNGTPSGMLWGTSVGSGFVYFGNIIGINAANSPLYVGDTFTTYGGPYILGGGEAIVNQSGHTVSGIFGLSPNGEVYSYDAASIRFWVFVRASNFIYLKESTETTQTTGGTGSKTSRTRYEYDAYGNVVRENLDADVSTSNDDVTVFRTIYPNTTANIISKPVRERVYQGNQASDSGGASLKRETLYYYDGNNTTWGATPTIGNLTRVESKKDATNSVSTYSTYDSYGNVLTQTDANGNTWTTTWDTTYHAYPATIFSPIAGQSESYTFDPGTNNLISRTDANDQTTSYEYDTFKRLVKVVRPGDSSGSPTVRYEYNNWGTPNQQHLKALSKVGEGDYLWSSQYFDGIGRVIQIQSSGDPGRTIIASTTIFNNRGLADKVYVSQDIASMLTEYYAPQGNWKYSTSAVDGLGRVTSTTAADGTTTSTDYSVPWQTTVTNERGYKKRYTNDAFGRLAKVEELGSSVNPADTDSLYATTTYAYDTLGNLTDVWDALGNHTLMAYDWLSKKTGMTDPDMGTWSYLYDSNGNLTSQTDAKLKTITMTYDALNRLTGKAYPAGLGMTNITYTYDDIAGGNFGKGRRTGITDAAGAGAYRYDARGRLTEEKRTIDEVDYTTGFEYDPADRLKIVTYPTGETVTQTYSTGRGLLNTLSGSVAGNLVTGMTYNYLGQVTQINLGNGAQTAFGYWDMGGVNDNPGSYYGKLWRIHTTSGANTLQDIRHTWDAGGNLTQRQEVVAGETEAFTYDFLDRLTSAAGPYSQSWEYDKIGNISKVIQTNQTTDYGYGAKPHAVTSVGSQNYIYDANGNMENRNGQIIDWDVENKPVSITGGATFVYDGDGNRVKKTEGGETVLYVNKYFDKNLTTSEITTHYYLGSDRIAYKKGSDLRYVHEDSLNSTSLTTNSSGAQVATVKFFPFGSTRSTTGTLDTDKLFTGQRLDSSGLYYYGARYYDAGLGRFLSPDTVVPNFRNPQALNRYSYAFNNPLKYSDPTGHFPRLGSVGRFAKGMGDAVVSTAKATVQMATNPVQTAKALEHAVTNPVETAKAIAADYSARAGSARGIGSIFGEALLTVGTGGVGSVVGKGGKVAEIARGASIAQKAAKAEQLTFDFMKEPAFSGKVSGLVIGRSRQLDAALETGQFAVGEYRLGWFSLNRTLGPEAEELANLDRLGTVMGRELPIRDMSALDDFDGPFLNAERRMLKESDWNYVDGYWVPPSSP